MTRCLTLLLFCLWAQFASAETLRLAVTTSFHNSGLSDVLLPAIKQDTGVEVALLVVGTGQALRLGQAGDVDAILVHSRAAEDAFVAEGFALYRRDLMYNDFVIVGPSEDPAKLPASKTAAEALSRIATLELPFISRGDDSGTHRKESSLWQSASLDPDAFGPWYRAVGAGMGASLNTAAALGGYILTDRASWLNFGNKRGLTLLFSGDPALFNQYGFLPVNPERHPHVKTQAVEKVEAWLFSDRAAELINGYRVNDQQLFTYNGG